MDKADFSFLVASFLYALLVMVERLGLITDPAILDLFAILLWGVLLTTTVVKAKYYLKKASNMLSIIGIILAAMVFFLSIFNFINSLNH